MRRRPDMPAALVQLALLNRRLGRGARRRGRAAARRRPEPVGRKRGRPARPLPERGRPGRGSGGAAGAVREARRAGAGRAGRPRHRARAPRPAGPGRGRLRARARRRSLEPDGPRAARHRAPPRRRPRAEAAAALEEALRLNPRLALAHHSLGPGRRPGGPVRRGGAALASGPGPEPRGARRAAAARVPAHPPGAATRRRGPTCEAFARSAPRAVYGREVAQVAAWLRRRDEAGKPRTMRKGVNFRRARRVFSGAVPPDGRRVPARGGWPREASWRRRR